MRWSNVTSLTQGPAQSRTRVEKIPTPGCAQARGQASAFTRGVTTLCYNDLTRPYCQLPGSRTKPDEKAGLVASRGENPAPDFGQARGQLARC